MIDFIVARDKLAGFETPDEIADYLKHEGIKACPGESDRCAIAVWAQKTVGTNDIRVSRFEMWKGTWGGVNLNILGHTPAMELFTERFDCGLYPELVVDGWDYDRRV